MSMMEIISFSSYFCFSLLLLRIGLSLEHTLKTQLKWLPFVNCLSLYLCFYYNFPVALVKHFQFFETWISLEVETSKCCSCLGDVRSCYLGDNIFGAGLETQGVAQKKIGSS